MISLRKSLLLVATAGIIAFGISFYAYSSKEDKPIFTTDIAKKGDIENVVLTNGVLYPYKLVNVGAQVSGEIQHIAVELGNEVKQGELIAQIDNLTQQNALKEAQASLNIINAQYQAKQAQIQEASLEFKRQKNMLSKGASSKASHDLAEVQLLVYQADLEQLVAQKEKALISVNDAELSLGYTTIEAPIDGTVVYVSVEEGQTVNTNQSTPTIIELAQLSVMTVKAQISEADVINVSPGQKVYFTILGAPNRRFDGVLRAIEPGPTLMDGDDSELNIGDSDAIYYNALFEVENPDHLLRIGMTAQVSIILEQAEDALLVPSQVLVKKPPGKGKKGDKGDKGDKGEGYQVPVLAANGVEYRNVEVGINNKIFAQILSGLDESDEIIIGESSGNSGSIKDSRLSRPGQRMGF